jgi:hypothetical protein
MMALQYPSTEGEILSSIVTQTDGVKGTTYGVGIRYTYSVGGRPYTGSRYRYDTSSSSDSAWAKAVVAARPPGSKVPVFYDPANPQNSVLAPGLIGGDLFRLAFMTPFNAVMIGLWWGGWSGWRLTRGKPMAGGGKIMAEPGQVRVRLPAFSPVALALATTGLLAFLSIFIVGSLAGGWHPRMDTMLLTWSVIILGGLAAGGWHALNIISGKYDLVLDKLGGFLELPATCGRKRRRCVPVASVQKVRVETVLKSTKHGEETRPMFAPTLDIRGPEAHSERLVEWYDAEKAGSFTSWLQGKLAQNTLPPPRV